MKPKGLPSGWVWATLDGIASPEPNSMTDGPFGSKLKTKDYTDEGVRVVRLGNIGVGEFVDRDKVYVHQQKYESLRKHEVFASDLVVAALAEPVGRCSQIPASLGPAIVKADCVRVKPASEVDARYLMHALNSPGGKRRAEGMCHGMGRLRINMGNMRELPVPMAPENEQRRIVAKIESLLSRSRRAKQALDAIPALLAKLRQSILAAAFRGDLTADWRAQNPNVEPAHKLLDRIRQDRKHRWEQTQLANLRAKGKDPKDDKWKAKYKEPESAERERWPLPNGWRWASFGEAFEVAVGATPSRKEPTYWNGDIPWVSSGEVAFCRITNTREKITKLGLANTSTNVYPVGTVLLGMIGEGKTRGQAAILDIEACNNQNSAAVLVSQAGIAPEYVYRFLQYQYETTRTAGSGNNQPALNKSRVRNLLVPVAPLAEQELVVREVERALRLIPRLHETVEAQLEKLSKVDQSTLAKAFRGELVEHDPTDEPASTLIERIRATRETAKPAKKPRGKRRVGGKKTAVIQEDLA